MALVKFGELDRGEGSPEVSEVPVVMVTHGFPGIVPPPDQPVVVCSDCEGESPEHRVVDFIEPLVGERRRKRPEVLARGVSARSARSLLLGGVWLRS